MKRPKIPEEVQILNVPHGTSAQSNGGHYLDTDSPVTARLTGDDAALFSIVQLETLDVEFDRDARPPQNTLVHALTVRGAGPIQAFKDEAILVTVEFACPADPLKPRFLATADLEGPGLPTPLRVLVNATPRAGTLQAFNITAPVIAPGDTETFTFRITSTLGHDVRVAFVYDSGFEPLFFAPPTFPSPVPANGSVDFNVPITCALNTPLGDRSVIFRMNSAVGGQPLGLIQLAITVGLPPPIPSDLSIVWEETTDLSISVNASKDAWFAGRITGIHPASTPDHILAAASTGGVWAINIQDPDVHAECVTDDLDNPNFNCLAFGPDSPLQIFGTCSSLKPGTRPGRGLFLQGLFRWTEIPIVDVNNKSLLTDDIFRILVLPRRRVLLLATMQGVFISFFPSGGGKRSFAKVPSLPVGSYSGMCVGPDETVAVSLWGSPGGIFLGTWSGNQLTFAPAQMIPDPSQPNGDINLSQVGRSSIASCGSNPSIMYAVFASSKDNSIYRILRSDSGGASWRPLRTLGDRVAETRLASIAPDLPDPGFDNDNMAGFTGFYTNCIAVGFHDSNEVGIGWANGPWLTSNASEVLSRWTLRYDESNSPHVHGDIQFILFDPSDPSGNTIYVASDGGLMFTRDRAGDVGYQSRFSKHIRNLQFYAGVFPGEKGAAGTARGGISASPTFPGLIAGPTQDNGNLFCALESSNRAWQILDGGDGEVMRFLSNGLLLSAPHDGLRAALSRWDGTTFVERTEVPVTSPSATALTVHGDVQPVTNPHFKLKLQDTEKLMFAVAATANASGQLIEAYGLFTDGSIGKAEWQLIATLPLQSDDSITSIVSLRGDQVFAGTQKGRIFAFAPKQPAFELVVSPTDKGTVHHIVVVRDGRLAFALYDGPTIKAILQTNPFTFNWDPLGSSENVGRGLNLDHTENFIALTVDRVASPPVLYACTDNRVFVSRDEGDTWMLATRDLPRRVHCTSFAIGAARPSGRHLYLSTYGRSVWQARI
jgi:hypothetical protein